MGCLFSPTGQSLFQLVATADPLFSAHNQFAEKLHHSGVVHYSNYLDLLRDETDLDAIILVSPIPLHEEMAVACLKRGLHVLLEKPPVPTLQQLDSLLQYPAHDRVAVGFQWISFPSVQGIKRWILEGRVGTVRKIRGKACWPRGDIYFNRNRWAGKMTCDGKPVFDGPCTNALAHLVHNIMFLGGETIAGFTTPETIEGELYRVRPTIESYDMACLRGRLASGPNYHLVLTHASSERLPFTLEIEGDRGWIRLSEDGRLLETSWDQNNTYPPEAVDSHLAVYEDFARFCTGKISKPLTSLRDTRGYLLATNGGLIASRGIHSADAGAIHSTDSRLGGIYEIPNIISLIETASRTMRLFSEMNLDWAVAGIKLHAQELAQRLNGLPRPTPSRVAVPK